MLLIGICGFKGSGKTTVARIIQKNCKNFVEKTFAKTLKDVVAVMYNWDRSMLEGDTHQSREWRERPDEWWSKKLGRVVTPRSELETVGTNLVRNHLHKDFWILRVEREISETQSNVIFPDCRFSNEVDVIRKMGGKIIHIHKGGVPDDIYQTHPSNWMWLETVPDYVINNDGDLEDLEKTVHENIIKKLNI